MSTKDKQEYLRRVFFLAEGAELCKTQKQFAELLEVDRTGLSSAMNGNEKYLTDSLIRKVRSWARENGLEGDAPQKPKEPDIVIPAATAKMYENLTETIRLQAEMLSRMQAGTFVAGGYAPKNSRIEND